MFFFCCMCSMCYYNSPPVQIRSAAASFSCLFSFFLFECMLATNSLLHTYVVWFVMSRKKRPCIKSERKKYAEAGFVLSIFWSAAYDVTPTPWGEKFFGSNLIRHIGLWNKKHILKLRSLPYTAHCADICRIGHLLHLIILNTSHPAVTYATAEHQGC